MRALIQDATALRVADRRDDNTTKQVLSTHQSVMMNRLSQHHLRTEPDEGTEYPTKPIDMFKASANQSVRRMTEMLKHVQRSYQDQRLLNQRAKSIVHSISSYGHDQVTNKKNDSVEHCEGKIRHLTIRYEQREKVLLLEIDSLKRKQSCYLQETGLLVKANQLLQEQLNIVLQKLSFNPSEKILSINLRQLEQQNQSLRIELEEFREEVNRSHMLTKNDAYRYQSDAQELRQHVGKLEQQLVTLQKRVNVEAESSRIAYMKLSETEKQSAHLVIENFQLKNKLSTLDELYQASQSAIEEFEFEKTSLVNIKALLKFYQQENLMLQRENTAIKDSSHQLSPVYSGGRIHPRHALLKQPANVSVHGRVKTEADNQTYDRPSRKSSIGRYDRQKERQGAVLIEADKQRLNDAIVKRCRLTLATQ